MEARWDLSSKTILAAKESPEARETYLAEHRTFVYHVASAFCKRGLNWSQDDELSVALIAFNDAIDVYNPAKGVPFLAFTRKVIQNRLTDYLRREKRHRHVSMDLSMPVQTELREAWEIYAREEMERERADEINRYQELLQQFGLSFNALVEVSPKHRDTRESFIRAAMLLSENPALKESLFRKKMLPIKELSLVSGLKTKTLERGRKYIIAVAIILSFREEFLHLRSYIQFPAKGVMEDE